jgi:predicted aspartyl protease
MDKMKVGSQPMIFMVDSGAEHSVVTKPVAPLTQWRATIVRATGTQAAQQFCQARTCQLGGHKVTHEFLYLPECPIPLLGRDLIKKLGAHITFNQEGPTSFTER